MGLFKRKAKGCIVFWGSCGRKLTGAEVEEMRDNPHFKIQNAVRCFYGGVPIEVLGIGKIDDHDICEKIPHEILRDIRDNGLSRKDQGKKGELYDFANKYLILFYGRNIKEVKCVIETVGPLEGTFLLLCPLY